MAARLGRSGTWLALIRVAGVAVFAAPVLYYSLFGPGMTLARGFLGRSLEREAEMLGVAMVWFTAAVPVAFVIIVIHAAAGFARHLSNAPEPVDAPPEESLP